MERDYMNYCTICGDGFNYKPKNDQGICDECYCPECGEDVENCVCENE